MLTRLGALKVVDPDAFKSELRSALLANGGSVPDAAKSLGVGRVTMFRWLKEDDSIATGIDLVRVGGDRRARART